MTTRRQRTASAARSLIAILLIAIVAGGGWLAWAYRGGNGAAGRYRTEAVQRGRVASLINASGTVVPEEVVDVGAQVAGKIVSFGIDPDDPAKTRTVDYRSRVTKGMVLANIDKALYAPEVDIARADLALAKAEVQRSDADLDASRTRLAQAGRDLDRAKRLAAGSSIAAAELESIQQTYQTSRSAVPAAEATLEKAKSAVKKAEALLEKADTNLRYTEIKSPVAGVIIDRRVNIGQTVVASLNAPSLFLIAKDLKRMQVWASVNEADIGRISLGQEANFKVDAYPNRTFPGVVSQVRHNATMTQNVVTFTVVVSVKNDELALLPYLTANLQFKVDARDDVLKVSNAALRYRPRGESVAPEHARKYVDERQKRAVASEMKPGSVPVETEGTLWVERGGLLYPIDVTTGLSDGNFTEVAPREEGALNKGDQVVVGEPGSAAGGGASNPFQVKMFSGKKKEKE